MIIHNREIKVSNQQRYLENLYVSMAPYQGTIKLRVFIERRPQYKCTECVVYSLEIIVSHPTFGTREIITCFYLTMKKARESVHEHLTMLELLTCEG